MAEILGFSHLGIFGGRVRFRAKVEKAERAINPRIHTLFAERAKAVKVKAERAETQRAIQEAAAKVRRHRGSSG